LTILDKLVDIAILAVLAVLGVYIYIISHAAILAAFIILLSSSILLHIPYNLGASLIKRTRKFKKLKSYPVTLKDSLRISLLSYLIYATLGAQAYLIFQMLGVEGLNLLMVMAGIACLALSSLIPVTIGGVGLREAVAVFVFGGIGVASSTSALFSILYTLVSLGATTAVGIYYLLRNA
jgi:uncharacterized membrane protein YbhN (UPF0104 family)